MCVHDRHGNHHQPPAGCAASAALGGPGTAGTGPADADPRHHRGSDRPAGHGRRTGPGPRGLDLGGQRLRPHVRESDAARRPGRGPLRPQAGRPGRARRVHRRLPGRRTGHRRPAAACRTDRPGRGRRDALARCAVGGGAAVRRRRAQPRAGHLVGTWRRGCRPRCAAGRADHSRSGLGLGLLRQRPRWPGRPRLTRPDPAPPASRGHWLPGHTRRRPGRRRDRRAHLRPDPCR